MCVELCLLHTGLCLEKGTAGLLFFFSHCFCPCVPALLTFPCWVRFCPQKDQILFFPQKLTLLPAPELSWPSASAGSQQECGLGRLAGLGLLLCHSWQKIGDPERAQRAVLHPALTCPSPCR